MSNNMYLVVGPSLAHFQDRSDDMEETCPHIVGLFYTTPQQRIALANYNSKFVNLNQHRSQGECSLVN